MGINTTANYSQNFDTPKRSKKKCKNPKLKNVWACAKQRVGSCAKQR